MIQKLRTLLFNKTEYKRNFISALWGTLGAQLILFLTSPILSRLYSPEEFGLYSILFGYFTIISIAATGRYELAIILPKNNKVAINVAGVALLVTVMFIFLVEIIIITLPAKLFIVNENDFKMSFIYLVPIFVLSYSIYQIIYYLNIRNKHFYQNSKGKMLSSVIFVLFSIGIGFYKPLAAILLISKALGFFISAVGMFFNRAIFTAIKFIKLKYLFVVMKRYIDFPKYSVIGSVVDKLGAQLPVLLISAFYSNEYAGYYAFGINIVYAPLSLVSIAISDVFRQRISEKWARNITIRRDYLRTALILGGMIIIPMLFLGVFSPSIFSIIFGQKWVKAGEIIRYVIPMIITQFIVSPLSSIFIVMEKQKIYLLWQILFMLVTLGIFGGMGYAGVELSSTLLLYSCGYILMAMLNILLALHYSKEKV